MKRMVAAAVVMSLALCGCDPVHKEAAQTAVVSGLFGPIAGPMISYAMSETQRKQADEQARELSKTVKYPVSMKQDRYDDKGPIYTVTVKNVLKPFPWPTDMKDPWDVLVMNEVKDYTVKHMGCAKGPLYFHDQSDPAPVYDEAKKEVKLQARCVG